MFQDFSGKAGYGKGGPWAEWQPKGHGGPGHGKGQGSEWNDPAWSNYQGFTSMPDASKGSGPGAWYRGP